MKKTILYISVFIILVVLLFSMLMQNDHNYATAKNGVLDLESLDEGGRVTLCGEWEFCWKELLRQEDFRNRTDLRPVIVAVPNVWNSYEVNGEKLPGEGYATYRLKVKVSDTATPLALRISSVSTAYRCYMDDQLIAENGRVSRTPEGSEPYYKPVVAVFTPSAKEFEVIMQVSNYIYARGGIWYEIDFGSSDQMEQYHSFLKYKDGIVIGSLAIMAAYFFFYFFMLRDDRKSISFMLMCVILIIRTTLYGDYLIVQMFPEIPFRLLVWITYLTIIWFPVVLFHMLENAAGISTMKRFSKLTYLYAVFMSILIALIPINVYTHWTAALEAFAAIIAFTGIIKILIASANKVDGANIILAGSTVVVVAGVHDVYYQANLIHFPLGEVTPIGLVFFMFLLSFLMADRFAKTYRRVETLSDELAEKLKHEKELTDRLYALDKLKDEFLSNTSHELRTPLNGIINITQSLLEGIGGRLTKLQRQNMDVILNSAKKLHVLINDLLDVSKLQYGGVRLNPASVDLRKMVDSQLFIFRHIYKNESVELYNDLPNHAPCVLADEDRLHQILYNLIGNAMKFTSTGGVRIGAEYDQDWMCIMIEDTGIGIPKDQLSNVFNAFEQIDGTIQRKYEGTGLGLYITRQLVELHGGKIWITSKLGTGTRVYFTLPIDDGNKKADSSEPPARFEACEVSPGLPKPEKNRSQYHILAVDDDSSNLQALMNILHLAGYAVKGVSSGKAALEQFDNGISVELVILDVMMPEMSGFEVLDHLRKKYNMAELPILMLTAKLQKEDVSLSFQLGANDFLTKPFEADELLGRVRSLVKLKNTVNQLVATELSFLQAQIKPHFIHNALGVISSLSTKDPEKTKDLILDLSDYLRGSFDLSSNQGLTTLSREIGLVRAYLSIEQERFRERLQVHFHRSEDIDCTLPLLTIQPLVENAIRHGIMCRREGGEIHIMITREDARIRIEVRDNGVGIEEHRINGFFELQRDQRGVGIANIHRRLLSLYGEGLHIESAINQGTAIYFYLPYCSAKEIDEG